MKKAGLVILFTLSCVVTFSQSHNYRSCCRYFKAVKGSAMAECVCPACDKDKKDEVKAAEEERKQLIEKGKAEQAIKDAADKKARETAIEKKNNTVIIGSPKNTEPTPIINFDFKAFNEETLKYKVEYEQKEGYWTEKYGIHPAKLLFKGKVVSTISNYREIYCVGPNIFLCRLPLYGDDACKNKFLQKNDMHLINSKGDRLSVGTYDEFCAGGFIDGGKIKIYTSTGACLNYSDNPRYSSSYKNKSLEAYYKDLSKITKENEYLSGEPCDCNGNYIDKRE